MPVTFTATITQADAQTTAATAVRDWALDSVNDDLALDPATGDMAVVVGTDGVVSDLKSRLLTFLGEWWLDTSIGFPWTQEVLGQKLDEGNVRASVEAEALACPGIVSVEDVTSVFDTTARSLAITFSATDDLGAVITAVVQAQQGAA